MSSLSPLPCSAIIAAVMLTIPACSRAPAPNLVPTVAAPSAEPSSTKIILEPRAGDTIEPTVTSTLLDDVNTLPAPVAGAKAVAAGRFEPSGSKFPNGLQVTWPLLERRKPGSQLHIMNLIEAEGRWEPTGKTAVVAPSGLQATGLVY
ncbi:MAG: hypothetical protein K8T89_17435, partial [Planctomycetes bacterium]|nr:hypothetical protein [Planctomycetota bacterium]